MLALRLTATFLAGLLATVALGAHLDPISAAKLVEELGDDDAPLVLDVRTEWEFKAGHVPGALHIPHTRLADRLSEVSAGKQDRVVVYCEQGPRAAMAEGILEGAGFTKVRTLKGHMANWRSEGYPMMQ